MEIPRLVIAGNLSGAGKTTLAVGLMASLRARGLRVQPFKCGPDYLDPAYHALAAGQAGRSIDSWLLSRQTMMALVAHASGGADVAIIEGLMGLYDGRRGLGAEGSTAEIAKWLRAPVLLILDISRTAQSAGAMAMGYHEFDREVQIIGVVLNNVASATHLARATEAVEAGAGLPVLGHLAFNPAITLPERHPLLLSETERAALPERIERTRLEVEATVDVEALLGAARAAWPLPVAAGGPFPPTPRPARARIVYLHDEAFALYQPDNLELLTAWGAEMIPVSPLRAEALPEGIDGLYIGPGFPERCAAELAANVSFLDSVRSAIAAGIAVYAECGGFSYLCEGIVDIAGERHRLVGAVPAWANVHSAIHVGYALASTARDSLLGRRGRRVRGYEFYWSAPEVPAEQAAYHVIDPEERPEGYARGRLLASNIRLHFGSDASLPRSLVESCAQRASARARS